MARDNPFTNRLPFMAQMAGHYVDTAKLSTEAHEQRPYGIVCGAITSTATGNVFDAVVERFAGGMFLYNAYATDFPQCYLESEAEGMACAVVASRSRFGIQALHAYLSGTGAAFDFGIGVTTRIYASGILDVASFGKPPVDDGSSLILFDGIDPTASNGFLQSNVRYATRTQAWIELDLKSGWQPTGEAPGVRLDPWSHRVEWKGSMSGGSAGIFAVLPMVCRPARACRYSVPGGRIDVAPSGEVRIVPDGADVSPDRVGCSTLVDLLASRLASLPSGSRTHSARCQRQ